MSSAILFYLSMLMLTLIVAKDTTDSYKIIMKNHTSRSRESENLRITLNYVRSKQEIYPSIFSLVSSNTRSNFADLVSEYVANESIVSYKITIDNFSRKYIWQNRIDLTWIFIIDDINTLDFLIHEQRHIWKATNQYLVIITSSSTAILSREIFQIIWKNYSVYRIIVISRQDDFRCLSRYLPFEKNHHNEYGVVSKICMMESGNNIDLYTNFENLNGYPIRVIVFQSLMMHITFDRECRNPKFSRLDANAMLLLEKSMSAQFYIKVFNNCTKMINEDPFHYTLRYIENGESDIIITSFIIRQYQMYEKYEFTTSVYEDKLCFIAPTAGFIPKSYMPIMPFALDLWIVLAIYNIFVTVLWFLIKYYSRSFRRQEAILLPLTRTTRIFVSRRSNVPPGIHPYVSSCFDFVETSCYPLKEDSGSFGGTNAQRVFLFGTLFFGLIITGLYQSCLMSSLSDPFHYPELNTLEDVANSNFTIITKYSNLRNSFMGNTTLDEKLRNKINVIVSDTPTNDMVAAGKVITITRYATVKLGNLSKYYDEDGNEMLHIVEEYPNTLLLSYVMRLHSPYRERINGLLLRMQEAGLVELWYEKLAYVMYMAEQKRKMEKSEKKIILTVEHYSFTFVGLMIGLFLCAVVFLAELYFAKRSQSLIRT